MTKVIEHFLARLSPLSSPPQPPPPPPRVSWPLAQLGAELKQTPVAAICLILK